jgi:hypothetical protein
VVGSACLSSEEWRRFFQRAFELTGYVIDGNS